MSGGRIQGPNAFSPDELTAIGDPTPFYIRSKVFSNLHEVMERLRQRLTGHVSRGRYIAPEGVDWYRGKIGNGDHLDGVPYIFLDMPRFFSRETTFTFRTLFWWGHTVSFSLILGGRHLEQYRRRLLENFEVLRAVDVHISTASNPWDWHRGEGHSLPLADREPAAVIQVLKAQDFLKCTRFLEFDDPDFRENRIDEVGLYTFRALEPLILE